GQICFDIIESQVAYVAVERVDIEWLELRDTRQEFSVETCPGEGRLDPFGTHGAQDMQRPGCSLVEPTLDRECSVVRLIGNLDVNAGGRFRQDERLANLNLLDHERSAF